MPEVKGRNILITGGAGFVGSFVVEQLLEQGAGRITIVDNLIRGSERNIEGPLQSPSVVLVKEDVGNAAVLDPLFEGIDYCFHLAALRITHCASDPRMALETMYNGTFNVLEACVRHQVKKVIFASSASVYGQAEIFPTEETHHPYNNRTLYGAAKMANELMLRSFHEMYGLNYNALRYFNIIGPRMDIHGKYTEVLIRWYHLIREGSAPVIFGDGAQTMDFVYVGEVARATILALTADVSNEVFNIASGVETSLAQLCACLIEVMGADVKPEFRPMPEDRKKVEVMRRLASVENARRRLNFTSAVDLRQGLVRLVQWLEAQAVYQGGGV